MNTVNTPTSIYAKIAKISFLLFLFFTFFGTKLPFQEMVTEIEGKGSSNIINQGVYIVLFVFSFVALFHKRKEFIMFVKQEKFLTIFLIWCLLSVAWSEFNFISFKRYFQIFSTTTVIFSFLLFVKSSDESLKYFKYILYFYVIISILSVLFIAGAKDPQFMTWRGLTDQKNKLGQAALINIIVWTYAFQKDAGGWKILSMLMWILSVILLFGTQSMSSILSFFALIFFGIIFLFNKYVLNNFWFGKFYFLSLIIVTAVILSSIFIMAPEYINAIPEYFGKDITLTGRTDLWYDMFAEAKKHLLIGCGFSGFWVTENPDLLILYENYVWLPNQSHSGYLDILNEVGLIGISIFVLMIVYYFINLSKLNKTHYWKWMVLMALLTNLTETSLFKPRQLIGAMFIFAYTALFMDIIKRRTISNRDILE